MFGSLAVGHWLSLRMASREAQINRLFFSGDKTQNTAVVLSLISAGHITKNPK
jgi:hypothetical protein